jgi:outer membrane lipoprotein-sorting protein
MKFIFHLIAAFALTLLLVPGLASADEVTAEQILDNVDDANRGTSSKGTMTMNVKTKRWERSMTMRMWSRGEKHSLVKILEPAKDAGMATLRVEDNIWNYLPKVDRTMKVPASMMSGSWMGSHFSNNDLVKSSRMADDYTWEFTEKPAEDGTGHYVLALTPNPEAPVVWGKVVVTVRPDLAPVSITYHDEDGELARTMTFEDIRDVDGKLVPFKMKLLPADEPDEFTEVIYGDLAFDIELDDSIFTLAALKR